jgi:hypothetical protein
MAWRIHDHVIRGVIDNRIKGHVRGELWLDGFAEPLKLELTGNACADLAGCLLEFRNPQKTFPMNRDARLQPEQRGGIGDLTASRKVRVFTVPNETAFAMMKRGEKPPERIANSLYLEWFSEANGRVVVESADYELTISQPEWRLTTDDEKQRGQDTQSGWTGFMQQLDNALQEHQRGQKDPEAEWDEHDYEKFMKECDARTDKYMELLEKYGDAEDAEAKIAHEMGWDRRDEAGEGDDLISVEEMNRITAEAANEPMPEPDPLTEGKDWIRTEDGDIVHPLQHRCHESAMKFWRIADEHGLEKHNDEDLAQFVFEFQTTGAKLAGALNGIAQDRGPRDSGFTVACLKRALDHLHKSQAGLETAAPRKLLPEETVAEARHELFEIREEILRLMNEYRGR